MHFERAHQPLLTRRQFVGRLAAYVAVSGIVVAGALAIGVVGYHYIADLPWIDALLNASMILSGMGPIGELHSVAGKLFASGYALFSGLVFVSTIAIILSPILHRTLHRFHLQGPNGKDG